MCSTAARSEPFTKQGALSEDQTRRLAEHVPGPRPVPRLDDVDRHLLDLLRDDGRAPVEDMARACGTSASTVRRRLHDLRGGGLLYLDVDVTPEVTDLPMRTMLWLTVAPAASRRRRTGPRRPSRGAVRRGCRGPLERLRERGDRRRRRAVPLPDDARRDPARRAERRDRPRDPHGQGGRHALSGALTPYSACPWPVNPTRMAGSRRGSAAPTTR